MKLSALDLQRLYDLLATCALGDIDDILIADGFARGVNPDRTCLIISDQAVPNFGGRRAGLTRLAKLKARLELFMKDGKFDSDVGLSANEAARDDIAQLEVQAGRERLQWRCASTANVKAPKNVNDQPAYLITINEEQLNKLLNAARLMTAPQLVLSVKPDGMVIFQAGERGDTFTLTNETPAEIISGAEESAVYTYSAAVFCRVLRATGKEAVIALGGGGTITVLVRGHALTLLPQIGESE